MKNKIMKSIGKPSPKALTVRSMSCESSQPSVIVNPATNVGNTSGGNTIVNHITIPPDMPTVIASCCIGTSGLIEVEEIIL